MFLDQTAPYALPPREKSDYLVGQLNELVEHHSRGCPEYGRLVAEWRARHPRAERVDEFPWVPVSLFKEHRLVSIAGDVMSVKSSATTTGQSSQVFTDKATRKRQTLSATRIWNDYLGLERRPCLVFDLESTVRGTASLGARAAAILSLGHHASEWHFVMRQEGDQLRVDEQALEGALKAIGDRPILCYGFTWILYLAHQELVRRGRLPALHPDSLFLHSGGWKRLIDLAVDKPQFNQTVAGVWGLEPSRVIDFYGTVEQVGLLYPDCPAGNKHVPYWADVLLRRPDTLAVAQAGETGLIELVSALPLAAPNHVVLTEDLGELVCEDGCPCGRRGRAFVFRGRAPKSEVRGCSDVARN
ncbi:MAG: hypothetical protein ACK6D3_04530 [Planctomycetaceae bacterium]|jgi:hypothetical protein